MELEEVAQEVSEVQETQETKVEEVKEEAKPPETEVKVEKPEESETDLTDIVRSLPPRKKSAQERIAEMTWKQREAERQAEYWKAEAMKHQTAPVASSDRPKLENFNTQEEYEDALYDWKFKQTFAQEQESKSKERKQAALREFNERANKIRAIHEDFDEVIENPAFTETMKDTLFQCEQGPTIAYYLGRKENYSEAIKIASLPPSLQPYAIGKLEERLIAVQKAKVITSAPPPITPVTTPTKPISEDSMSDEEWVAMDRKRTAERRLKPKYGG